MLFCSKKHMAAGQTQRGDRENDRLKAGNIIARIDPAILENKLASARANRASAKAERALQIAAPRACMERAGHGPFGPGRF